MENLRSNFSISRRALLAGITGTMLLKGVDGVQATTEQIGSTDDLFIEPAPISEDPYIVVAHGAPYFRNRPNYGWDPQPRAEQLRTILGLHPDLLDFKRIVWLDGLGLELPPGAQNQLEFALDTGYPGTSGQTLYISSDKERAQENYGEFMEQEGWTFPNSDSVSSPTELVGQTYQGDPHGLNVQGDGILIPSVFAEGALDIQTAEAESTIGAGFSGMFLDSITTPRLKGLDFSRWAIEAFSQYLSSLDDSVLESLSIDDPSSFNIRSYLEDENITPGQSTDPRTDPIFREFHRFHHQGLKTFIKDYQSFLKEQYPDRKSEGSAQLFGNQYVGTDFGNQPASAVYLSDVLDFVNVEDNRTLPPKYVRDVAYKFFMAASRYEKPVVFEGQMQSIPGNDSTRGLDPTEQFPTLQRLQIAEAYAMGAVRKLPLTGWGNVNEDQTITHWIQPDGSVPDTLQSLSDFLHANRRFLKEAVPENSVGLVFSVPTAIWNRIPQWNIQPNRHLESFRGAAKLLRESAFPYDVVMFGDPELYPDEDLESTLSSYETVILPGIDHLTTTQLRAVESFLESGGTLLISGTMPSKNESHQELAESAAIREHQNTTILAENPARERIGDQRAGSELIERVPMTPVGLPNDSAIGVNQLREHDPERLQIHLVNYEYDADGDTITQQSDFEVSIPTANLGWDPGAAEFRSPQTTADLTVDVTDGLVTVTVPELHEWGFIVLATDEDSLASQVNENEATNAISTAQSAIDAAPSSDQTWSNELIRAELELDSAETLYEAGAYGDTTNAAMRATQWADRVYATPVIGIDVAHGQTESFSGSEPFSHLQEWFPNYEYQTIRDWSDSIFEEIDVLLVPPALSFRGVSYNFTSDELDKLESWVSNGGSLVTFARGDIAADISDLTTRFGFEYEGSNIVNGQEPYQVDINTKLHTLTRGISSVRANLGTPISTLPDTATVLARTPSETEAWLHKTGDLWTRESGDESAADRVLYASAPYENGRVIISGIHSPLINSGPEDDPGLFMENLLHASSKYSNYANKTTTETSQTDTNTNSETTTTENETATETSNESIENTTESTETTTPGFGVVGALGSITGAAAVLNWYRSGNESKED